ncbi:MAG: short-chain dehydrogenase, partial [Pseudorhodobacter sp.]|nr:short-chain dehydrogenase [Frankiaceae bacterium]
MSWSPAGLDAWRGRTVIVTGGNSGIGLRAAQALRGHRAGVGLACRGVARARAGADGRGVR